MKLKITAFFLCAAVMQPVVVKAQVMDTSAIQQIHSGQYRFAEGEIQVTFVDTVSPDFVKQQMKAFGHEILELDIKPITARIKEGISDSLLVELSRHPFIESVHISSRDFPEQVIKNLTEQENLSKEEAAKIRQMFKSTITTSFSQIQFKYQVTEEEAKQVVFKYPDFGLKLSPKTSRSVVLKTEVGKEEEVMDKLEPLGYVKSTAYIAVLE